MSQQALCFVVFLSDPKLSAVPAGGDPPMPLKTPDDYFVNKSVAERPDVMDRGTSFDTPRVPLEDFESATGPSNDPDTIAGTRPPSPVYNFLTAERSESDSGHVD